MSSIVLKCVMVYSDMLGDTKLVMLSQTVILTNFPSSVHIRHLIVLNSIQLNII